MINEYQLNGLTQFLNDNDLRTVLMAITFILNEQQKREPAKIIMQAIMEIERCQ